MQPANNIRRSFFAHILPPYAKIKAMGINEYSNKERLREDREGFRALAMDALRKFTPEDRETAASLESEHVKTSDVLKVWAEQIAPLFADLASKHADKSLKRTLMRAFGFSEHEVEVAIRDLVEQRKQSLIDEVVSNLYHVDLHDVGYQQAYAENFFHQPEEQIDQFMYRYGEFILAIDISESHHITLSDAHSSWLDRQRAALAIHKERQRIVQNEDMRLEQIDAELAGLTRGSDRLLAQIVENDWEFATILDLQAKYKQRLAGLSAHDRRKPAERLKAFDQTTRAFRDSEAPQLLKLRRGEHDLKQLRTVHEEISSLLLEVFELKASERTRLVANIEQYSRLTRERTLILTIQRDREQFLALHG